MCFAIALDQPGAFRDFRGERGIERPGAFDKAEPRVDRLLFAAETPGAAPPAPHPGQRAQFQEPGHRGRIQFHPLVPVAQARRFFGARQDAPGDAFGQHVAEFGDAGFQEFGDDHRVAGGGAGFGADARQPPGPGLGLGHPDDVLEGHADGEMLCHRFQQRHVAFREGRKPVEIGPGIGGVLEIDQPRDGMGEDRLNTRRKHFRRPLQHGFGASDMAIAVFRLVGLYRDIALRGAQTGIEPGEIGVDRLALGADARPEGFFGNRHRAAPGDRAQQHGADMGAGLARGVFHVEQDLRFRPVARRLDELLAVGAAVAHLHFLGGREYPVGRGDQQRAVRGDVAGLYLAAGFQQFGRCEDIDLARRRAEREDRFAIAERVPGLGPDFDVIGSRPGTLCDARNRRRLHRQVAFAGGIDDPARQHAAALAAERRDQQGDRRGHDARPCIAPMTDLRMPATARSRRPGLRIRSAR